MLNATGVRVVNCHAWSRLETGENFRREDLRMRRRFLQDADRFTARKEKEGKTKVISDYFGSG